MECVRPTYEEAAVEGMSARELVLHHGIGKAANVAKMREFGDDAWVIGSDQGLIFEERLVGKPGTVENAVAQLMAFRGRTCELVTSLCLYGALTGEYMTHVDTTELVFAELSEAEIRNYVACDMPLDCAGSFKIESRGPELFEAVRTEDPTAIEGLPVMALCGFLRKLRV